jgi:hypothetical protein
MQDKYLGRPQKVEEPLVVRVIRRIEDCAAAARGNDQEKRELREATDTSMYERGYRIASRYGVTQDRKQYEVTTWIARELT